MLGQGGGQQCLGAARVTARKMREDGDGRFGARTGSECREVETLWQGQGEEEGRANTSTWTRRRRKSRQGLVLVEIFGASYWERANGRWAGPVWTVCEAMAYMLCAMCCVLCVVGGDLKRADDRLADVEVESRTRY